MLSSARIAEVDKLRQISGSRQSRWRLAGVGCFAMLCSGLDHQLDRIEVPGIRTARGISIRPKREAIAFPVAGALEQDLAGNGRLSA